MAPRFVPTLTPDQRLRGLARARELRAQRAASLRSDFPSDDEAEWQRLADEAGVTLPPYGTPLTTAHMERWLARLGIGLAAYLRWNGAGLNGKAESARLGDFGKRNPTWPLKAWVGLVLEAMADGKLS